MRFKASIRNISTFTRLTASLNSLGKFVWLQLNNDQLRFTVVPEQGSQVWAVLAIDTIFETYTLESASANNIINLRVPLPHLHRALRSALSANSASIRLTKKDDIPLLTLTIVTSAMTPSRFPTSIPTTTTNSDHLENDNMTSTAAWGTTSGHERETTITQDIPVQVLAAVEVATIHEPVCPQPDVHIMLPPLLQLKSISERFTKLALTGSAPSSNPMSAPSTTNLSSSSSASRLLISANANGELKIGVETPTAKVESRWVGLVNPELDPEQVEGGEEGVREHASTRMKERAGRGEETWSLVRVEGRDWGRVLAVGRMGGRVIACFCHEQALILYVYLQDGDGEGDSVLTYYISSYSA